MSDTKIEKKPTIFEAIPLITGAIEPIAKGRKNKQQDYDFRGIDDVYAALNLLLAKHGISILPEILESRHEVAGTTANGKTMYRHFQRVRFHLIDSYGTEAKADAEGEGMDMGDKATAKAASTAYKSMAFQVFCIPTGEKIDSEEDSPEVEAQKSAPASVPHSNGNGHPRPAPAVSRGADAVTEAKAFSITSEEIKAATSAGDLTTIAGRLPQVAVTEQQRKILDAQIKRKLESFQ